jgi:ubiquitin carboxyl-terminal hydrolase 9/13
MRPQNSSGSRNAPSAKKDQNAVQPTPMEKLLADIGGPRTDGSDKFFGMENVSLLRPLLCGVAD